MRKQLIMCLCLLFACSGEPADPTDASSAGAGGSDSAVETRSASHEFDGVWVWSEDRDLYAIEIDQSKVAAITRLHRRAPNFTFDTARVDICELDGLCSIEFLETSDNDAVRRYFWTFDEGTADGGGYHQRRPHADGYFVIETRDMNVPLPRERMTRGVLRKAGRRSIAE